MTSTLRHGKVFLFVIGVLIMSSSCVNTKKAIYFNDINDTVITEKTPVPETRIRKNDILSISVSSLNKEATEIFNSPNESTGSVSTGGTIISGYLVGSDGKIDFPILGSIKAEGLTKDELKLSITKSLTDKKLLVDPIVGIRFLNFRVTVLGEVRNPTVLNIPNEKISLMEAIGLAGDLTIYAKRDNVLVIREENGEKIIKRINLNSTELLTSPYYYLKSEDIVYIEPNRVRVAMADRSSQWVPIAFSALSFAAILVDRVGRKN